MHHQTTFYTSVSVCILQMYLALAQCRTWYKLVVYSDISVMKIIFVLVSFQEVDQRKLGHRLWKKTVRHVN